MLCNYFHDETFGFCSADGNGHVPTIYEMERYCFSKYYRTCPRHAEAESRYPAPYCAQKSECLDRSCRER